MGNPTTCRGATATWLGRQLMSYTKGNTTVSYKYDENGLRTQKTVKGVIHDYYYVGNQLVYEKLGDEYEYFYCYDADGRLAMVERVIISRGSKGYFFTITGYYICRNGKNYTTYVYTSGKYSGLVATVIELSKKQMQKFGLW